MTSPSCPVRCNSPFPAIAIASTNWTSPPKAVQTRPTDIPGDATRSAASLSSNLGGCIAE
uniref:Serine protease n=1 Tax=Rhizophora mucronata TaxID=61149 RepID=A0A2P2KX01_RHIMU